MLSAWEKEQNQFNILWKLKELYHSWFWPVSRSFVYKNNGKYVTFTVTIISFFQTVTHNHEDNCLDWEIWSNLFLLPPFYTLLANVNVITYICIQISEIACLLWIWVYTFSDNLILYPERLIHLVSTFIFASISFY